MTRIYPWWNFVDLWRLFFDKQELIFPFDAHATYLPILLPVLRNGHWSPENYCKTWTHFRVGQGKRQAKHPLGSGYLLPECNGFPIPVYLKIWFLALCLKFRMISLRIFSIWIVTQLCVPFAMVMDFLLPEYYWNCNIQITHVIRKQLQAVECHTLDFKLFVTMHWWFLMRNNRQLHMQVCKFIVYIIISIAYYMLRPPMMSIFTITIQTVSVHP
jgi:hypothetical protein